MTESCTVHRPAPLLAQHPALAAFLAAGETSGTGTLSEHKAIDIHRGPQGPSVGLVLTAPGERDELEPSIVGYAHASGHGHGLGSDHGGGSSWGLEIVADPALRPRLLDEALAQLDGAVHWWVYDAQPEHDALAASRGLRVGRDLLKMRCPLPLPKEQKPRFPAGVRVEAFRPGIDDGAWLAVNARSFADHPEQGAYDQNTLERRMAEPWFDPAGFWLAWDDGGLAGFCWTKIQPDENAGEIYAIGVDPSRQGLGLGRALTAAGLDSIAGQGWPWGILYVDGANRAAVGLYESIGFTVIVRNRAYER